MQRVKFDPSRKSFAAIGAHERQQRERLALFFLANDFDEVDKIQAETIRARLKRLTMESIRAGVACST